MPIVPEQYSYNTSFGVLQSDIPLSPAEIEQAARSQAMKRPDLELEHATVRLTPRPISGMSVADAGTGLLTSALNAFKDLGQSAQRSTSAAANRLDLRGSVMQNYNDPSEPDMISEMLNWAPTGVGMIKPGTWAGYTPKAKAMMTEVANRSPQKFSEILKDPKDLAVQMFSGLPGDVAGRYRTPAMMGPGGIHPITGEVIPPGGFRELPARIQLKSDEPWIRDRRVLEHELTHFLNDSETGVVATTPTKESWNFAAKTYNQLPADYRGSLDRALDPIFSGRKPVGSIGDRLDAQLAHDEARAYIAQVAATKHATPEIKQLARDLGLSFEDQIPERLFPGSGPYNPRDVGPLNPAQQRMSELIDRSQFQRPPTPKVVNPIEGQRLLEQANAMDKEPTLVRDLRPKAPGANVSNLFPTPEGDKIINLARRLPKDAIIRHGTDPESALGIIKEGLRPGSSVSKVGGRDFEGYPVTFEFDDAMKGAKGYSSPFGPTMHEGAAKTGTSAQNIKRVFLDADEFSFREDAEDIYNQMRRQLDESGRKDVKIERASFDPDTEKWSYGGDVTFEHMKSFDDHIKGVSDKSLERLMNDTMDNLDAVSADKAAKHRERLDKIINEMYRRLPKDATVSSFSKKLSQDLEKQLLDQELRVQYMRDASPAFRTPKFKTEVDKLDKLYERLQKIAPDHPLVKVWDTD